jgi:hypothetical protein
LFRKDLSCFQTITSFANKARLGGQSLANLQTHPFAPFHKELIDFTDLMDKLQLKIEDSRLLPLPFSIERVNTKSRGAVANFI